MGLNKPHKNAKKAKKKKRNEKKRKGDRTTDGNRKAYAVNSVVSSKRQLARAADLDQNRYHNPLLDKSVHDPPPVVVVVHGPRKVGKTTLIKSLIRHFTRRTLGSVDGPMTVVAGKTRRLTFVECPPDLNGMIDSAKFADVVLLMIDLSFGFELETFEFVNLLQVCLFSLKLPDAISVRFPSLTLMSKARKKLKNRFEAEVHKGAKLFCLSGFRNRKYLHHEVKNLGRFISVMKIRPLSWRTEHPYLLADRFEDITFETRLTENAKCDREILLYGYLRGTNFRTGSKVHISGVGDVEVEEVEGLADPCPLPSSVQKRSLNASERQIYAPMSDLGGFVLDKDAVYVDIPDWKMHYSKEKKDGVVETKGDDMVRSLQRADGALDDGLGQMETRLFETAPSVKHGDFQQNLELTSTSEDEDQDTSAGTRLSSLPAYEAIEHSGRIRKRVLFKEAGEMKAHDIDGTAVERSGVMEKADRESADDKEALESEGRWKATVTQRAAEKFKTTSTSLQSYIYDDSTKAYTALLEKTDRSRGVYPEHLLEKWKLRDSDDLMRNRFTTGDWEAGQRRADTLPNEFSSEGEADFEDLELDPAFAESTDPITQFAHRAIQNAKVQEISDLLAEKKRKKAQFDAEYDASGGGHAMTDEPNEPTAYVNEFKKDRGMPSFYSAVKEDMEDKLTRTRQAMDVLDTRQRILLEGFRPGTYLRMKFKGIPCELVECFTKSRPILVGGLDPLDVKQGCMRLRMKRHRWFPKILKTRDPLVFSVGWRRFQSLPIYCTEDHNRRLRYLKYTPEHAHCQAVIWGPLSSINTSFAAFQNMASNLDNWRISATGTITEIDADIRIVKKLKLVGTSAKIEKTTSFITGMFNSALEVAKFEGASIRTVSGIRGTIKKAVKEFEGGGPGTFRASFEDRLVPSDIVFLRSWAAVQIPHFCNPITDLLSDSLKDGREISRTPITNQPDKDGQRTATSYEETAFLPAPDFEGPKEGYVYQTGTHGRGYYRDSVSIETADENKEDDSRPPWPSMRTVAEIRRSRGIGAPQESDSYYQSIDRAPRQFSSLKIPSKLLASLPYVLKPKPRAVPPTHARDDALCVVPEAHERRITEMLHQLKRVNAKKIERRQLQRARQLVQLQMRQKAEAKRREAFNKEERKKRYKEEAIKKRKTTDRKPSSSKRFKT